MACTLSLGLTASCSLSRPPLSSSGRFQAPSAAPLLRAHAHRVQAVAGLASRGLESASSLLGHSLNAPSEEELSCPVALVHSPQDFQAVLDANKGKLVVLMCKATHCRPCKMFARKYATAARQYSDAVFLEIFGDESKATRQMMIDWKVKVTPTFVLFRDGQLVHNHGGINETKLHRSIAQYLQEGEAGYGSFTEPELGLPAQ